MRWQAGVFQSTNLVSVHIGRIQRVAENLRYGVIVFADLGDGDRIRDGIRAFAGAIRQKIDVSVRTVAGGDDFCQVQPFPVSCVASAVVEEHVGSRFEDSFAEAWRIRGARSAEGEDSVEHAN